MTLVVVPLATLLVIALGGFAVDLAETSSLRARAQTAADAAALAAIAESAPGGRGLYEYEARRFADANGARLLWCECDEGATAVQVKVAIHHVTAEARAVIDATALQPAFLGFDRGRLHPSLAAAVDALIAASKGAVRLVSGYRSPAEQSLLWNSALSRYGSGEAADDWVARPGSSMHERGLAVDLGGDLALAVRLIDQLGLPLYRPLANEAWHFELLGSRSA